MSELVWLDLVLMSYSLYSKVSLAICRHVQGTYVYVNTTTWHIQLEQRALLLVTEIRRDGVKHDRRKKYYNSFWQVERCEMYTLELPFSDWPHPEQYGPIELRKL